MLINLHVKNLALIEETEVDFTDHLNILTGETGAGKSILIGSIQSALGAKIPKDMIRNGCDSALIELIFHTKSEAVRKKMEEFEIPFEDGEIIISRRITNHYFFDFFYSFCLYRLNLFLRFFIFFIL